MAVGLRRRPLHREDALPVSWNLLGMPPKAGLNRIDEDVIEEYYPEDAAVEQEAVAAD